MYASFPSSDATISWGSGPEGMRASTCSVAGSTIATVLSLFANTRSVPDEPCANAVLTMKIAATKQPVMRRKSLVIIVISPNHYSQFRQASLHRSPRRRSRGPCPLKVIAAELTRHIHDLADEKKARNFTAFHRLG